MSLQDLPFFAAMRAGTTATALGRSKAQRQAGATQPRMRRAPVDDPWALPDPDDANSLGYFNRTPVSPVRGPGGEERNDHEVHS